MTLRGSLGLGSNFAHAAVKIEGIHKWRVDGSAMVKPWRPIPQVFELVVLLEDGGLARVRDSCSRRRGAFPSPCGCDTGRSCSMNFGTSTS